MHKIARGWAVLAAAPLLVACGGGATGDPTPAPTAGQSTAAKTCDEPAAGQATTVAATVKDFAWSAVTAKVGDVITWSNGDGAPHGVMTDDGTCKMDTSIPGGGTGGLVFSVAGTYPFTCTVHATMKGTITITP